MTFSLPLPVRQALEALNARGYPAYVVGGCVRDLLRGEAPHDYDICSAALPQEVHACFAGARVVDTGARHGTVTVILAGMPLEITTFRSDGDYLDGRHPQSVAFTRSLEEDLKRRDFTVNAMAYHPEAGLVDLYGGQADLAAGVIRCVGDAPTRLTEDALRILRALRFAARLGFVIEQGTAEAMHALCGRLALVSRERIAEELVQAVACAAAPEVLGAFPDVFAAALPDHPPAALALGLAALRHLPPGDAVLRMAALLAPCPEAAEACLFSLRPAKAFHQQVLALSQRASAPFPPEETAVLLAELGESQFSRLVQLQAALGVLSATEAADRAARMQAALDARLPLALRDLPITGEDLAALGLRGPQIGQALQHLHRLVLTGALPCDRKALLAEAERGRETGDTLLF